MWRSLENTIRDVVVESRSTLTSMSDEELVELMAKIEDDPSKKSQMNAVKKEMQRRKL